MIYLTKLYLFQYFILKITYKTFLYLMQCFYFYYNFWLKYNIDIKIVVKKDILDWNSQCVTCSSSPVCTVVFYFILTGVRTWESITAVVSSLPQHIWFQLGWPAAWFAICSSCNLEHGNGGHELICPFISFHFELDLHRSEFVLRKCIHNSFKHLTLWDQFVFTINSFQNSKSAKILKIRIKYWK
jgi:hypothetical protein